LFLTVGSIEDRVKTTEIGRLGGLGRQMPMTLCSLVVAALAVSSVPPLNGFFSKMMLYQGIIETGRAGNTVYPLLLAVVLAGSGLTLVSFLKLFVSFRADAQSTGVARVRESGFVMWSVTSLLALVCILFGVWVRLPLRLFIDPSLRSMARAAPGSPVTAWAAGLTGVGIVLGLAVYFWDAARRRKGGVGETAIVQWFAAVRARLKTWRTETGRGRRKKTER